MKKLIFTIAISGFTLLQAQTKKNILFIAVDDLKPLINAYGYPQMVTPNIDRLIKSGVMFKNAEVQQAVCGPSRASVMTGTYPDRTHVWDLQTDFREASPSLLSMPEYLISQGYETSAIGKIYHKGSSAPGHDGKSWSIPHFQPNNYDPKYGAPVLEYYQDPFTKTELNKYIEEAKAEGKKQGQQRNYAMKMLKPSTESADVSDEAYQDGLYAKKGVQMLKQLSSGNKPFFLAVGFQKPHLPFVAPKKYWDLYDRNNIELAYQELIKGAPQFAYHDSGELNSFTDIMPKAGVGKRIPAEKQKELIHGYMACISYMDAQVGKLLDELDRLKLTENTIIVLWGDHGYHLGDHTLWNKHSNFEQATRIPLVFSGPNIAKNKAVSSPVELIDVFPTLFDLIDVKTPAQVDGKSLLPLIDNNDKTNISVNYAMSQFPRQNGKLMGYSIRTENFRYTEWLGDNYTAMKPYNEANIVSRELYDFKKGTVEKLNEAENKEYASITNELHNILKTKLTSIYLKAKDTPYVKSEKKGSNNELDENANLNKSQNKKGKKNKAKL